MQYFYQYLDSQAAAKELLVQPAIWQKMMWTLIEVNFVLQN